MMWPLGIRRVGGDVEVRVFGRRIQIGTYDPQFTVGGTPARSPGASLMRWSCEGRQGPPSGFEVHTRSCGFLVFLTDELTEHSSLPGVRKLPGETNRDRVHRLSERLWRAENDLELARRALRGTPRGWTQ